MFIFNFNYIKDLARITMDEKCNGIYCEAETDRYQIAKNSYNLLMPNDVFNSKTYTIFVFIISIMIFIYYYRMLKLYDYTDGYFNKILYFFIHALLLTILLWMIIYRYTPYDEQGYLNYFKIKWKDNADKEQVPIIRYVVIAICSMILFTILIATFLIFMDYFEYIPYWIPFLKNFSYTSLKVLIGFALIVVSIFFIVTKDYFTDDYYKTFDIIYAFLISLIPLCVVLIKRDAISIKIITTLSCFIASIFLVIYLMNIVMTFRNNTTPILKTKPLKWSLRNSLNNHLEHRITEEKAKTNNKVEYDNIKIYAGSLGNNISSVLDIYLAFEELSKIVYNTLTGGVIPAYTTKLKDTINKSNIYVASKEKYTPTLSLIFDKKVSIPSDYGDANIDSDDPLLNIPEFSSSHEYNSNDRNTSYVYTADISYDNANLFYEKYWDMKDTDFEFLWIYDYALPVFLKKFLLNGRPNLPRLFTSVGVFIVFVIILVAIIASIRTKWDGFWNVFLENMKILAPFISLVVFVLYIIVFIWFNTHFNKNVVYKCLDCSYKRSLNKLNTVVSPYIRMYDNKITGGNKDYTQHYIIANVFYSILSGNINLLDATTIGVKVKNGGSGYKSAPNVVFTPSGAIATAILGSGDNAEKVISINVTSGGGTYATAPIISFTGGGGGSGADATANITGGNIKSISINDVNDDIDYSYILNSKLADMDSNILTTEENYREYYKMKFKDLYNITDKADIDKIYNVFNCVFARFESSIDNNVKIANYFDTIINYTIILKIYLIIKRCIKLFEKDELIKNKTILNYFKFYKNKNKGGELIPYKFILILKTKTDYDNFVKDIMENTTTEFNRILTSRLNLATSRVTTLMTNILSDITDEDSTNQNIDIQSKCIIKIIAKYLLIMGHINYNMIDYNNIVNPDIKSLKFSIDTLGLYQLISNVSYADTFKIDDTFGKALLINISNSKYYTLTYMYNYLDTKYVILSSNKNNNYLLNIIKSINNTLNNDNKTTITNDIKEARYLFRDRINDTAPEKSYENEDAILMKADMISTTYFELTYFVNMLILLLYITGTIFFKIK